MGLEQDRSAAALRLALFNARAARAVRGTDSCLRAAAVPLLAAIAVPAPVSIYRAESVSRNARWLHLAGMTSAAVLK